MHTTAIHNATDHPGHCPAGPTVGSPPATTRHTRRPGPANSCGEVKVKVADQGLFYVWAGRR